MFFIEYLKQLIHENQIILISSSTIELSNFYLKVHRHNIHLKIENVYLESGELLDSNFTFYRYKTNFWTIYSKLIKKCETINASKINTYKYETYLKIQFCRSRYLIIENGQIENFIKTCENDSQLDITNLVNLELDNFVVYCKFN